MPSITDLKKTSKSNKLFEKKEYRPWGIEDSAPPLNKDNQAKQIEEKIEDIELEKTWRCLYGAKRILLELILKNIEETHKDHVITEAITTNQLASASSLPINTIKTSLQKLKQHNLIINYETKPGKGGFARYQIPKNIYEYFVKKFSSNP